jgi:hypothetical protein
VLSQWGKDSGMNGIAELLANLGYLVTGSDLRRSDVTDQLAGHGITVHEGHDAGHVGDAVVVVVSSAVRRDNPEVVEARRDGSNWIVNAPTTLQETRRFFEDGRMPGCKAGHRFLVVTSDGWLQPCSMVFQKYRLEEHARMVEEFTKTNTCDECYVSIRSYLDKSFPQLLWENVSGFLTVKGKRRAPVTIPEEVTVQAD